MENNITVSILCITYNHEKYIAKAIESFLFQKTNFPFEVVVADDASTDANQKVIREYAEKYHDFIRPILRKQNIGANNNWIDAYGNCRGKYLALCDGDDYWTDPLKLQKQVDFLEAHPDYAICTHGTERFNDRNEREGTWFEPPETKDYYTLEDFISYGRTFIATSSLVARNYRERLHDWFSETPAGDMAFIMSTCLQENGKIKRLREYMSAHTMHEGGMYSRLNYLEKQMFSIEARIFLRRMLPAKYEPAFKSGLKAIMSEITSHVDGLTKSNSDLNVRNRQLMLEINRLAQETRPSSAVSRTKSGLSYRSYQDLSLTIKNNLVKIPRDIDLVVGVPRSGMLPATMIGQILNKPVVALDSYIEGKLYEIGDYRRPTNLVTNISEVRKVLVIDDSINSGGSMKKVKERIKSSDKADIETIYSAVYYVRDSLGIIDIGFEECPWPRVFQWNVLNSWVLANACVDIDGVVCADPTEEENDDGEKYKKFLLNARPLFLTEFKIGSFVTSRLEKYRSLTEEWLRKHNLNYGELVMLDLPSKEERIRRNAHATFKAEVYRNRREELFIESSLSQALQISKLTGKLVFCTENMEMIAPGGNDTEQSRDRHAAMETVRENNKRVVRANNVSAGRDNGHQNSIRQKAISVSKTLSRILFVNHNLYPYENSGTPISTFNHAVGMSESGMEVAVMIPSTDVATGYDKQTNDKFTLYRLPRLDKYKVFIGDVEPHVIAEYLDSVRRIIADFAPDVVHINDYVYMPAQIVSTFHEQGIPVVRGVCNMEELCHMDSPVVLDGMQGRLCKGPESAAACAECFFINRLGMAKKDISPEAVRTLSEKIERRFDLVKSNYADRISGVIFTEKAFQEYFSKIVNIRKDIIRVIPRGFKFDYTRVIEPKEVQEREIRFGYIAHLMFTKGTDVVLTAFEKIAASENFHLDLHGAIVDQAYHDWVVRLEKSFPNKIKYHGPFKKDDILKIAESTDMAIVPSHFDTYNRAVRELLYLGVPQIVTNFFGSSIINHNVNGLKIPVGDYDGLAEVMKLVIDNPKMVHDLSEGAINTKVPTLADEVHEMSKFYSEIVSKNGTDRKTAIEQKRSSRLVAFYLPQYHPIPENDEWWGKGFTEWRNVTKAKPLFEGHHQPQLPSDLGFYDLRLHETLQAQAELAKQHGIQAFCFWHYWFNGKLLLEKPLLNLLNSDKPDFQFCLAWANENWTRRWDGHDQEILQEQKYGGDGDDRSHFNWLLPFLMDKRAFKIENKPVFLVYRPGNLPNPERTIDLWRKAAAAAGLPGIFIMAIKTSFANEQENWTFRGFDGELLFQPNFTTVYNFAEEQKGKSNQQNGTADATVVNYRDVWRLLAEEGNEAKKRDSLFTSVIPGWDNTARRTNNPLVLHDSNPEDYSSWLSLELDRVKNRHPEKRVVFINAWNEWAEGNHLEPDLKFGRAFLEATKKAVQTSCDADMDKWVRSEELYEKAQAFIEDGDNDQAISALQEIIKINRHYVKAMNDLAVLHSLKGDNESSIKILNKLLNEEPENIIARRNLANIFVKANRLEDGLKSYLKVLRNNPSDIGTVKLVTKLCLALGLKTDAFNFAKSALEIDPHDEEALALFQTLTGKPTSASGNSQQPTIPDRRISTPNEDMERITCPFCASANAAPYRKSADVVKCAVCGTVYLRTRLTKEAMAAAYQSYADGESHLSLPQSEADVKGSGLRRNFMLNEIEKIVKRKGTLLDVGCGWGAFLENARGRGFKVRGIEITPRTAEFARNTLGIDVTSSQFTDTEFESNSISVVTMLHVLEHLPDPKAAISRVFDILEPGGLFAGIVPNIDSVCSAVLEDKWEWFQPMYHYVHYSPSSLRKHLEEAGFKIEKIYTTAGDYNRAALEKVIRAKFSPATEAEYNEVIKELEDRGCGEEIRFFALKTEDKPADTEHRNKNSEESEEPVVKKVNAVEVLYDRSGQLISSGKYEEAAKILEQILTLEPSNSKALNDLAVVYSITGNTDQAISVLSSLVKNNPSDVIAFKNLAKLYIKSQKIENALETYMKALVVTPNDVEVLITIADICVALNKLEEAKFFYFKVLMITPDEGLRTYVSSRVSEINEEQRKSASVSQPEQTELAQALPDAISQAPHGKRVSIIIPVFNKVEFTRRCIDSIFRNVHHDDYEVIVVDNESSDGTREFLTELSSRESRVKYIRNETNLGFVESCNIGARNATGDYVLLLNNDTEVNPDWLEALLDFAEKTPECGAIGSKLIYPDGRLQEAGGITFSDGNGWNYGRGGDPNHPKFNFVREVDYISGASLMVRKSVWDKIGGLDMRYAPAYYEDADLCFAVRRLGYKVFYQPRSSLVHYEGITSGTNLNEGFKKFQVINRPKFIEKWKAKLVEQYPNDPRNVEKASSRGIEKRIFVTDPILPMFDRAAGSLHLFNILKILKKMNFHITFVSGRESLEDVYKPILQDLGIETYAGDPDAMVHLGYATPYQKIDYAKLFHEREFDIALIDFWHHAEYYLPVIRKYSPSTTVVIIDTEDIHYVRELREAEIKGDGKLKMQAIANKEREVAVYGKADRLWVVTEEDRQALMKEVPNVPIDIRPVVHQLPEIKSDFESRQGILFVGNFNHTPNLDAVKFFIEQVLPKVKEALPELIFYIVGNDPKKEVMQLSSKDVVIAGYVEDLAEYYNKCKVVVAPLRYGAGLKGKIVESLSYGVPVVTTSVGVEGTGLMDGEDIMVADDPDEMAKRIIDLYSNKGTWERLSQNGRKQMESKWSFDAGRKRLEDILLNQVLVPRCAKEKLTSIVILTYNQLEYTKITIDSIRKYTKAPYEIIVVDNASTDATVEYLKAQKDIRTVFNQENLGFPSGCNEGMEIAAGEYIVLLNNDVVVTNDWLEGLIECAESMPSIGIVGSMTNNISGFQREPKSSYKKASQVHEFAAKYRRAHRKFWLESPKVAGFCMLIKRKLMEQIGGFDIAFGIGNCEDDDYCVRAALAGFKVAIAGDVFIHHFGSKSFTREGIEKYKDIIKTNEEIFREKWGAGPMEWWREGKSLTKTSPLYVPFNVIETVTVQTEG
jgi:GT2 family glycosyltransferase/tetratricopeptide (TPR) repeat protein/uncharacterized HAD superfamily protein/hypoxanthine phosphoribosyltransferase